MAADGAAFQNLCDAYLKLKEEEVVSFNRTGSQIGKQKTVAGTPDTFLRLTNGSLIYVEYTTTTKGIVKKLKDDIDKCLDEEKTGVPRTDIDKLVICFNSRLKPKHEKELIDYASEKRVGIELIGLDTLAIDVCFKYLILAKDMLGMPLDTGQVLSLSEFVSQYNSKGNNLSTPLDNQFLHRQNELDEITTNFLNTDFIVLSGPAGVGKTKLALYAIEEFLRKDPSYSAFAIAQKDRDIFEDLKIHLKLDGNYILLVDDTNRQLINFKQVLGVFRENRKGNIKIISTVRDYALPDVIGQCSDLNHTQIQIERFTDDEIKTIIESDSFEIRHSKYQQKIITIADGNARLAVMAARLAQQKQWAFIDGDVFDLFDTYFQTFIKDSKIFNDTSIIKTLGIISFFFSIDKGNKTFMEDLLKDFGLDYYKFMETVNELEKMELLETRFNIVRVSEQVMATYFFYKVFIKDDILAFRILLDRYYIPTWKSRFTEAVISANNLFYYTNEEVLKKLGVTLGKYLDSIEGNDEKLMDFFDLFWIYKRDEMLAYFHNKIKGIPEPQEPVYEIKENPKKWENDKVLYRLSDVLHHITESFVPALDLAFEYCRKKPEEFPVLLRRIKDRITFNDEDRRHHFKRQSDLFDLIIKNATSDKPHYMVAFFDLSKDFLAHHYHSSVGGRRNTIILQQYTIPLDKAMKKLREKIWNAVFERFKDYPHESFSVIRNFSAGTKGSKKEIADFDTELLYPFLRDNLDVRNFEHVYFMNDPCSWIYKKTKQNGDYKELRTRMQSEEYECFKRLDMNSHRGKQDYEFKTHEEFQRLKERDIRRSFIFKSENDFVLFHRTIKNLTAMERTESWWLTQAVDIVTQENIKQNEDIGFTFLKSILDSNPPTTHVLRGAIYFIMQTGEKSTKRLWDLLKIWPDQFSAIWKLEFFALLPEALVNQFYKDELLETVSTLTRAAYIPFDNYEKFSSVDNDVIAKILRLVVEKIETTGLMISVSHDFFEKHAFKFVNDFDLLAKAYFQYEKLDPNADYDNSGLKSLIQLKPDFLTEYVKHSFSERHSLGDSREKMGFIWDIEDQDLIKHAIETLIEVKYYSGVGDHEVNMFFNNLTDEQKNKAEKFIMSYITDHNKDAKRMNVIFDVLRHRMNGLFDNAYRHYLSLNTDIDTFKKIMWRGNGGGIQSADVLFGELEANDWRKLYETTERIANIAELIPIKAYLKKKINQGLSYADHERKMKFIDPHY